MKVKQRTNYALIKSTSIWLLLAILAVIVHVIAAPFPQFVDKYYTFGLFQVVRFVFDYTSGLLPFPTIYLFFAAMLYLLIFRFLLPIFKRKAKIMDVALRIVRTASILVFAFYVLWGWSYNQSDIADLMELEEVKMKEADLAKEYQIATKELTDLIQNEGKAWNVDFLKEHHYSEAEVRSSLEEVLSESGFSIGGRVRGRLLSPRGTLLVWNTAGIYIPFVGEGHVDQGLLAYQLPYTLAHEMSHGYGVTDEGSCNFTAFLACRSSSDSYIRFSGVFGYWRYIASEFRRSYPEEYRAEYETLPPLVIDCLQAIRENDNRYPEWMPKMRYKVYDNYLKAQGIHEGMRNYSRVVQLVHRWRVSQSE